MVGDALEVIFICFYFILCFIDIFVQLPRLLVQVRKAAARPIYNIKFIHINFQKRILLFGILLYVINIFLINI